MKKILLILSLFVSVVGFSQNNLQSFPVIKHGNNPPVTDSMYLAFTNGGSDTIWIWLPPGQPVPIALTGFVMNLIKDSLRFERDTSAGHLRSQIINGLANVIGNNSTALGRDILNLTTPASNSVIVATSGGSAIKRTAAEFLGDLGAAAAIHTHTKSQITDFPTTTSGFSNSTDKNFVTDAKLTVINNTTGTNTGDNATNSQYSGLVSNATHTGDATGSTALTLATVNANVGSFGSATQVPTYTVNAKGLVTAASNTSIQIAESQVTNLVSDLALKAALTSASLVAPNIGAATGTSLAVTGNITSSAGSIGYATGAGGAVTQTGNRSSSVTINKISGAITTVNTSLAAGAEASFTVTNSTVAIGDVILVSARSGQTAATSIPFVTAVANGSFQITLSNFNASTADTGAMIINFVVIKAVSN